jgi:type I restriction enzyme, R subunit
VKKVTKDLLRRRQSVLALYWRKWLAARARVQDEIGAVLDEGLPRRYSPELYRQKCGVVFQHVFETFGAATSSVA